MANLYLLISFLILSLNEANLRNCIKASRSIAMEPYCWGCDPTIGTCVLNCQQLINTLYSDCDGVCLPDGYYFDPKFQLSGCWDDVSVQILVSVERCGCNSAIPKYVTTVIPLWMLLILIITYLLY